MVANRLPEPVYIETDPSSLTASQHIKLTRSLGRLYNFTDYGVLTLAERIASQRWDHKIHEINYYASHKINGCYRLLKRPRHTYSIFLNDIGLDVPKAFYDIITNLPENIWDHKPPTHYAADPFPSFATSLIHSTFVP